MAVSLIDPVAQTFFVDSFKYPKGMFVHSVDLIFKKKDTTTYQPFNVQLRPVLNGYPHSSLIHSSAALGQVSLRPEKINTVSGVGSDVPDLNNPNHYTRFKFPAPVYLIPGEHALVLFSNSDDYEVFIAEIGGTRLDGTNRRVDKQLYAGSFFKSQNGSTYTAFQDIDLVFRLNACSFSTTKTELAVKNKIPASNVEYDLMKISSQDLTFKDSTINYFHRLTDNTTKTISSTFTNILVNENKVLDSRKVVYNSSADSLILKAELETTDNTISPMIDTSRLHVIGVKNIINDCGISEEMFTIIEPGTGYTSNAVVTISGIQGSGASVLGIANTITGQIDSIKVLNSGLGYVDDILATVEDPPIISGNTTAIVSISSEVDSKGGPAIARYITRKVTLADGFDSNMIRVYMTAYNPNDANIEVYYKVLAGEDPTKFDDRPYVRMFNVQQGNESIFNTQKSQVINDFLEYLFIPLQNNTSYVGLENSVNYSTFKTFAIKIVMRTRNTAFIPIIRDLRVLALAP
jgi:hypothetical protein